MLSNKEMDKLKERLFDFLNGSDKPTNIEAAKLLMELDLRNDFPREK